jgi:hypothetical protein
MRSAGGQLLDRDRRGGASDSGGADGYGLTVQLAVPNVKLSILSHVDGILQVSDDLFATSGISGKNAPFSDVARRDGNVKLQLIGF